MSEAGQREAEAEVRNALAGAADLARLPDRPFLAEEREDRKQNIRLKWVYAIGLLVGLGLQIGVVDAVLFMYAYRGVHWVVDANVIYVWLSATVVEVIGVVFVVTRHLFPTAGRASER